MIEIISIDDVLVTRHSAVLDVTTYDAAIGETRTFRSHYTLKTGTLETQAPGELHSEIAAAGREAVMAERDAQSAQN